MHTYKLKCRKFIWNNYCYSPLKLLKKYSRPKRYILTISINQPTKGWYVVKNAILINSMTDWIVTGLLNDLTTHNWPSMIRMAALQKTELTSVRFFQEVRKQWCLFIQNEETIIQNTKDIHWTEYFNQYGANFTQIKKQILILNKVVFLIK